MQSFEQHPEPGEIKIKPHYYPNYIKISGLVVFCFLLQSVFFSRKYINSVIACNTAEKQYLSGDFQDAKENYAIALDFTPNSESAKIGMAITCFANKDTSDDVEGLEYLNDINLSHNEWEKIYHVIPEKFKKYMGKENVSYR